MSVATIQLTQSTSNTAACAERSLWPLSITALGVNMPSEIFVYQVVPVTDYLPGDRFQCVASAPELQELPVVSHIYKDKDSHAIKSIPFYRTSTVTFNCHSLVEAQSTWQAIQDQTQRLVDNYNQWQSLQTQSVVVISPALTA